MHVVVVGACYWDTILSVPRFPDEDEKLRASGFTQRLGGNCANTLMVFKQLLGFVNGKIIRALGEKVNLRHCIFREDHETPASSYIIRNEASDTRTIVNHNPLPEMTFEEFRGVVRRLGDGPAWFHFEGRIPETTLQCMKYLREHRPRTQISVEIEKPNRLGLQGLAAEADVVFYSRSWAVNQGFSTPAALLNAQSSLATNASLLLCTWGKEGGAALQTKPNFLPLYQYRPSEGGQQVVDTVGAGDTFIAGMLFGLTCPDAAWDLGKKVSFAHELAQQKVFQEGFAGLGAFMSKQTFFDDDPMRYAHSTGTLGLLRLQELRAFLEKKGLSPWGVKAALVARIDEYYARRFYS